MKKKAVLSKKVLSARARTAIKKALRYHCLEIGKHRDALRKIHSELEDVLDSTDEGLRDLAWAIDRLSERL